jgi:myosin heavy subunit
MATMKLLSSKDDQAVANHLKTQSGIELKNLATAEPVTTTGFLTKQKVYDEILTGNLKGNMKEGYGESYDHVVVELGTNADYAQEASKIILNRFQNPNIVVVKNQGNGRVQTKNITGTKEVLFALHQENNGDFHLHVLTFRYAIDGKTVNPQDSQKDKYVRALYLDAINKDLTEAGLAPLRDFTTSITSPNAAMPKASITTQNEVKDILSGEIDIEDIQLKNTSISETVLEDSIAKAEKLLAQTLESAKKQAEEINQLKQAHSVLDDNKALTRAIANLRVTNEELENNNQELKSSNEDLQNDLAQKETVMFEQGNQIQTLLEQVKEKEAQLKEAEDLQAQSDEDLQQKSILIDSLQSELNTLRTHANALTAEKAQVENTLSIRDSQLEQANGAINALQETSKAKDSQIELQKELNKQLQEKFETQMAEQKRLFEAQMNEQKRNFEARIAEQNKEIEAVKSQLADKTKENSILKDFVKIVEQKLEQANTIISSLSTRLKAGQKAFISAFVEDTKQVSEFNKNLEDTNDAKAKKLAELQALFKKNKEGVDSFTEQQKQDQAQKNKNTGGTGTPPKKN